MIWARDDEVRNNARKARNKKIFKEGKINRQAGYQK